MQFSSSRGWIPPTIQLSLTYVVAWLFLTTIVSCGKSDPESGRSSETAATIGKAPISKFLSIGTAPPGGAFFVVGSAIAEVVDNHLASTVSAEATKGTQENIRLLGKGDIDFAMANAAISYFAVRGEGKWEKPYPIRSVMTLAPNVGLFVTKKSSQINSIADLRRKRVSVGPEGAGFEYFLSPIFQAHGLTYDDFKPLYGTYNTSVDMLADNSARVAFLGGAVPNPAVVRVASTHQIHFIPFDPDAMQQLFQDYPFFMPAKIPANTYKNQHQDFNSMNVGSMHLITAETVDQSVAYQFTRALYEHRAKVAAKHPAGKAINPKNIVKDTGIPFHPGAIQYYKEIGIWPK